MDELTENSSRKDLLISILGGVGALLILVINSYLSKTIEELASFYFYFYFVNFNHIYF